MDCFGRGICDIRKQLCIIPWNDTIELLLKCLDDNVSPSIKSNIQKLGLSSSMKSDCIPSSPGFSSSHSYFGLIPGTSLCATCDTTCYDISCNTSIRCQSDYFGTYKGSQCNYRWALTDSSETECLSEKRCNWDESKNESECVSNLSSDSFCGYCFTKSDCIELSNVTDERSCVGWMCLLSDGSYQPPINGTCTTYGRCSLDCIDGQCHQSKIECERQEFCDDYDNLFGLDKSPSSLSGYCVDALDPFDRPPIDCANRENEKAFASLQGCILPKYDENNCTGQWIDNPNYMYRNQSVSNLCKKLKMGCYEPDLTSAQLYTNKTQEKCNQCSNLYRPTYEIQKGQWIPAKRVPIEWIKRSYTSVNTWNTTINLNQLFTTYSRAAAANIKASILSQLECSYNPMRNLLKQLVCQCNSNNTNCEDESTLSVGKAVLCPNVSQSLNIPPISFSISELSVQSSECITAKIELLPKGKYSRSVENKKLSTSFVSTSKKHIPGGYVSVINSDSINIGQLLGDGVTISIANRMENVMVCISTMLNESEIDNRFTTWDFGTINENFVKPLYLSAFKDVNNRICAKTSLSSPSTSLFPIIRLSEPESIQETISDQDKGLFIFIAVIYGITFVFSLSVLMIMPILSTSFAWVREALILLASAIRLIYFALLASSVFSNTESTIEYIMIEIPTFLYTSVAIQLVLIFGLSLKFKILGAWRFAGLFGLLNLLLYMMFIVIIILFSVLKDSDASSVTSCGGRIFTYSSQENESIRVIRIVYRVTITFFTFLVSISLVIIGIKFHLFVSSRVKESRRAKRIQTYFILAMLTGACLLMNSIGFLIYFIVDKPSSWFVIALLLTECAPWIYVTIGILNEKKDRRTSESNSQIKSGGQSISSTSVGSSSAI
eukprot:TRINITY_DN2238_c0_g1_i2.p1 TRINITY_DN2238_c0_g1~~TRINITY_DN2238_c0_g1_i2.p1  ORF type:complete len:995 (-),score=252.01 TRINITY_DN2238_c0_g1_i2:61-2739(-)